MLTQFWAAFLVTDSKGLGTEDWVLRKLFSSPQSLVPSTRFPVLNPFESVPTEKRV